MRVLAINQFYLPDHAASSQLLGELCQDLVAAGDSVSVIASRGTYLGGRRLPPREILSGVDVIRPWATSLGKGSRARRMTDYLSFWASAIAASVRSLRPDVIVAASTPPMIAAGAATVATARGVPLVTWVHDIYPDIAAAFGVMSGDGPSFRLFTLLARATHSRTQRIVTLSDDMAQRLYIQGAPRDRVRVIPNWSDGRFVYPRPHEGNPFRAEHGLQDRFVVMYSGNLGEGHDMATFMAAARALESEAPHVLFLFVGSGSREHEARELARGLANVRFLPYQPRARLGESLPSADVHLISLQPRATGLLVPSKLYGALASGRPVLYVGPAGSEVARVIREHRVGWEGRNGDAAGLAAAILKYSSDSESLARTGEHARACFDAHFDRAITTAAWRNVLREARS